MSVESLQDPRADPLIAMCYEAASGRVSFNAVMHAIAQAFDCMVVQTVGIDLRQGRLIFSYEGGDGPPEGVIDYTTTFHRIDPHAQYLGSRPVGSLVAFSREFSEEFIAKHPFYQEFLIPYGVRHSHGAKLYEDVHTVVYLGMHRAAGRSPIDGDDWGALQRLCFHLTRVAALHLANRAQIVDSVIGRLTLDRLKTPVLLVEQTRHVVLQNKAAESVVDADNAFYRSVDGRLCCSDRNADTELTLALRELNLSGQTGLQHTIRDRAVIRADVAGSSRPLLVSIVALRPEATMGAFGSRALAMLVVFDSNRVADIDPFALATAFALSPAEAKVAVGLARGHSSKEIANRLGVSVNTVRTQTQAVHQKFGVSRTSEFIALIHSAAFSMFR